MSTTENILILASAISGATAGANIWSMFSQMYVSSENPEIWVETLKEEIKAQCFDAAHEKKALGRVRVYLHACRKACAAGLDPSTMTKDEAARAKPEGASDAAEPAEPAEPTPKTSKSTAVTVEIPELCDSLRALIQASSLTSEEWKALMTLADTIREFGPVPAPMPVAERVDNVLH